MTTKRKKSEVFWMLHDAGGGYTGHTLWPTRRIATDEKNFQCETGKLPTDGKWRIEKVKVLRLRRGK